MSVLQHALTPDMMAEMLNVLSDAVIAIDDRQHIIYFNGGSEAIFGYASAEVLGQPLDVLLPTRMRVLHQRHVADFAGSACVARPMAERCELVGRRKTGEEFPAVASIAKLCKHEQQVCTVILRDISEHKRNETELHHKSKQLALSSERNRLARDLHDGLAQTLGYLKMRVGQIGRWVERGQAFAARQALEDLATVLNVSYIELRQALEELRRPIADEREIPRAVPDLAQALSQMAERSARQGAYQISLAIDPNLQLAPLVEMHLLRIAQEALANARKHALARQVSLRLSAQAGQVHLLIEDDGQGFDLNLVQPDDRYGLRSMHERAQHLGAQLEITSAPGNGTRVKLALPHASAYPRDEWSLDSVAP